MGSHKSRDDEIYEQGVHDGQEADFMDEVIHAQVKGLSFPENRRRNEIYNKGFEYGVGHRPEREVIDRPEPVSSSSDAGDSDLAQVLGKVIGVLIVVAAVLWFIFVVAIPLIVINVALGTLIIGLRATDARKFVWPLSIVAAAYLVLDVNQGWLTTNLARDVPPLARLVSLLFYLNVTAGLVAAFLVIRNSLDTRWPPLASGVFTGRNAIIMVSLSLVGGVAFIPPTYWRGERYQGQTQVIAPSQGGEVGGASPPALVGSIPSDSAATPLGRTSPFVRVARINDPDGYTNIRREPSGTSEILGRVLAEEDFYTHVQEGDWWLVRTINGIEGYMHVSRIVLRE